MARENRIVVDYGDYEGLVLTGVMNRETGEDMSWEYVKIVNVFDTVDTAVEKNIDPVLLKKQNLDNKEGYVIKFEPSGYRMKIKFAEYVRLHSLITNFSTIDIWKALSNGDDIEGILDNVPDEFDMWVREKIKELKGKYASLEEICRENYNTLSQLKLTRKDFAIKAQKCIFPSVLFSMLDNKEYSKPIWAFLKPEYEKPFWNQ